MRLLYPSILETRTFDSTFTLPFESTTTPMWLLWEGFQSMVNCPLPFIMRFLANRNSDLLNRHIKLSCVTGKRSQIRGRSACDACAKAKLRCSRSVPCTRCRDKGISCLREPTKSSTNQTETENATLETSPWTTQCASVQESELPQNNDHEDIAPDPPLFSLPQVPLIPGKPL